MELQRDVQARRTIPGFSVPVQSPITPFVSMADYPNPDEIRDVDVTLLLAGGHQYTLSLSPDNPLLQQLFEATVRPDGIHQETVFQLPINKGRSVLCFRGDRLMGLITDPPIMLQETVVLPDQEEEEEIFPSDYALIENFLTPGEHKRLLDYTLNQRSEFVTTTTSTGAIDYRKSVVLHSFPEFSNLLLKRIRKVLPEVFARLKMQPFPLGEIESQLTAHNDGNFYKVHNDNGSSETATRELTYVYYFYREPKAFTGGELILYDSKVEHNFYVQADTFQNITPVNNSIVFFPSRYMHEVLPVSCPSRDFADSRFTINGWVRRV